MECIINTLRKLWRQEYMDYEVIRNDNDFHEWHSYAPIDTQYVKYADSEPSVVVAGHKIEDVYYCFANARASFMSAGVDNYGDISSDNEISKKYTKSHFLTYAVLEYAICLDISWKVIWAYIQPTSFEYLINRKYKEMEKECTSENLHLQLNCAISQRSAGFTQAERIKQFLINFEKDSDVGSMKVFL